MKKAFITGVTGQDGSYLAELLIEKGYEVHGLHPYTSTDFSSLSQITLNPFIAARLFMHKGDLCDSENLSHLIRKIQPDEVYNLGAASQINDFINSPELSTNIAALGTLRLLESIRQNCKNAKFFQAVSSELFGNPIEVPQTELTPMQPRSLYGIAKLYAYLAVINYRESHQLFACNGILYNHESPRRKIDFVTKKIVSGIVNIHHGLQNSIILGNLDTAKDWGYAKDFVEGMWLMLQQNKSEDFILATGQTTTVRKFVELVFLEIGIQIMWVGEGINEKGIDTSTKQIRVTISPEFYRESEKNVLVGNSLKAQIKLNWKSKTTLNMLVKIMMQDEISSRIIPITC